MPHEYAASGNKGPRFGLLCSYYYFKRKQLSDLFTRFAPLDVEIMADSGGFQAWSMGTPIAVQDYIAWLKAQGNAVFSYANLDAIGDPVGTWRNQQIMEEAGLLPIPVFHYGSDWKWLDHYQARYPYIMLGGMVSERQRGTKALGRWLLDVFRRASRDVVFHGLGTSSPTLLEAFPFYSADSSSWQSGVRYGSTDLYDPWRHTWVRFQTDGYKHDYDRSPLLHLYGLSTHLMRNVLRTERFDHKNDRSRKGHSLYDTHITSACATSWMVYERYLQERHGKVYIPRSNRPPGMRYYLVNPSDALLRCRQLLPQVEAQLATRDYRKR